MGARAWRVVFASCSLPLAYSWIVYFIAHAHDGLVFWDLQPVAAAHAIAWTVNFLSFFFLYPSVFNLKEVAAPRPEILRSRRRRDDAATPPRNQLDDAAMTPRRRRAATATPSRRRRDEAATPPRRHPNATPP